LCSGPSGSSTKSEVSIPSGTSKAVGTNSAIARHRSGATRVSLRCAAQRVARGRSPAGCVPWKRDQGLLRSVRLGRDYEPARERRLARARGRVPGLRRRRSPSSGSAAAATCPAAGEPMPAPAGATSDRGDSGGRQEVRGHVRALRPPHRLTHLSRDGEQERTRPGPRCQDRPLRPTRAPTRSEARRLHGCCERVRPQSRRKRPKARR
jgi:hypothetical protein